MRVPGLTSHVVLAMKRRNARGVTRPLSSFSIAFTVDIAAEVGEYDCSKILDNGVDVGGYDYNLTTYHL